MNSRNLAAACAVITMMLTSVGFGQQIDQSIARELGLVRQIERPAQSGEFDIELNVGKRMELVFPEQGKLDIRGRDLKKFEFLNVNNSLFVTALEPLGAATTGMFTLHPSQQLLVLNFRTVEEPVEITSRVIQPPSRPTEVIAARTRPVTPVPGPAEITGNDYDDYVRLSAFAARTAYAPDRLTNAPRGVRRVPLQVSTRDLKRLSRESELTLTPLSSWVYQGLHVTVVELENTGSQPLHLTPDLLRGRFVTRSFQHNRLGTADTDRYSAAYVISQAPFQQVLDEL